MNFTTETIAKAEQAVENAASQQAYLATESITHPVIQRQTYILMREAIITGARLMQEKLMEIIGNENKIDNYEQKCKRCHQGLS